MQTVISSLAHTFIDDALALVAGFVRVSHDVAASALAGARAKLSAPIERLARRCDVAGVLPAGPQDRGSRFDVLGISATLRALRELT